jgi:hypothetical protein
MLASNRTSYLATFFFSLIAAGVATGCGAYEDPAAGELTGAVTSSAMRNSGYYDHTMIAYTQSNVTVGTAAEAALVSKGNIVFHMVGNSTTPTQPGTGAPVLPDAPQVQCAPLGSHVPPEMSSNCNVLNFIPTEKGYKGGAWHLEVFTWNEGANVRALTKDDDIFDAVAAGEGTLNEDLPVVVRCPVNDFSGLR